MLSTQSDDRLVDLVRAGSDPAFEAIVERYRRALMRYVSRILPAERAEDVVQQTFVKAYEAMHRDAADLHLRPWLYRIAHNSALNALRDRALGHAQLSERIDGVERPDQALERAQGLRELVVAVQALPDRQRSAILLRELEGRSYDEIAIALGVTDGAVRQLLNRARNSLRAAAASVLPLPMVERLAASSSTEPVAARVGELVGAGGGALAMKLCATALVTGAVVGGAAAVPDLGREDAGGKARAGAARPAHEPAGATGDSTALADEQSRGEDRRARADGGGRRSGSGGSDGSGDGSSARGAPGDDGGGSRGDEREHRAPGDDERTGRRGDGDGGPGGDGGTGEAEPELEAPGDPAPPDGGGTDGGGPSGPGSGEPLSEPTEVSDDRSGTDGGGDSHDGAAGLSEPDYLNTSGSGSGG